MADIKAHVAKVKAIIGGEQPQTTVETTTVAPQEEAAEETIINQD